MRYISVKSVKNFMDEHDIEVVDIVRCHECMFYMTEECPSALKDYGGYIRPQITESGFCSTGRKKGGGL